MTPRLFQSPETVRNILIKRFKNQHQSWLTGQGQWPLALPLGCPKEEEAIRQLDTLQDWIESWQVWQGTGEVIWSERRWRMLGKQRLPERLLLRTPVEVAAWLEGDATWKQVKLRYDSLLSRWPTLNTRLHRFYDVLSDYSEEDYLRLERVLAWLERNPASNLYPRQLPIPGVDSKWLEERSVLITVLLTAIRGRDLENPDFYRNCGLRKPPQTIRMRILDRASRKCVGGLSDISAPLEEIRSLKLPATKIYIVENLQTGLAFEDRAGSIVIMGLGYDVEALSHLSWLADKTCIYWGDLDTHGFSILNLARKHLPDIQSMLMDEETLLSFQELWAHERQQHPAGELPLLTELEQKVYQGLKRQRWGTNVRLEQERIPWSYVSNGLSDRLRQSC